jgi:hypothetical protein
MPLARRLSGVAPLRRWSGGSAPLSVVGGLLAVLRCLLPVIAGLVSILACLLPVGFGGDPVQRGVEAVVAVLVASLGRDPGHVDQVGAVDG